MVSSSPLHASLQGYLLDQFLNSKPNQRTDNYGSSIEDRCRFPLEVFKAVVAGIGKSKLGVSLALQLPSDPHVLQLLGTHKHDASSISNTCVVVGMLMVCFVSKQSSNQMLHLFILPARRSNCWTTCADV